MFRSPFAIHTCVRFIYVCAHATRCGSTQKGSPRKRERRSSRTRERVERERSPRRRQQQQGSGKGKKRNAYIEAGLRQRRRRRRRRYTRAHTYMRIYIYAKRRDSPSVSLPSGRAPDRLPLARAAEPPEKDESTGSRFFFAVVALAALYYNLRYTLL